MKFVSFNAFTVTITAYFVMFGPFQNPFKILDFMGTLFLPFIINSNITMEGFLLISSFISSIQAIKMHE